MARPPFPDVPIDGESCLRLVVRFNLGSFDQGDGCVKESERLFSADIAGEVDSENDATGLRFDPCL